MNQHSEGYQQLREQAVQYMRDHTECFQPSCVENESLEEYLNRMAQLNQWAEGPIIGATALLLNMTIDVMELEKREEVVVTNGRFTASKVHDSPGTILMVRVNPTHYHLGLGLQYCLSLDRLKIKTT